MLPILAALGKMIIFVSSKVDCESITQMMKNSPDIGGKGLLVDSIHGDKHQIDRNAALASLRKGKLSALIATDVASRGLDVDDIQTVVNFDAAKNLDSHVHRIGRAGRLNASEHDHKKGVAYTLLTHKNSDFAKVLMDSFEREGREVSDDLMKLSMKSKHFGGGGRRKWNKAGLGFEHESISIVASSSVSKPTDNTSYYGPVSSSLNNNNKRGRWGEKPH
jgi:ATP-dependent RNA helicase DDX42